MSARVDAPGGFAVAAESLRMIYGSGVQRLLALDAVNLFVPSGQLLCVTGPSGSGKSSLLHLLAGLRRPAAGRVTIGETEITALSEDAMAVFRRRHIGLVFQFFNLIPSLTVRQNVALPLLMDGISMHDARDRVDALLERLAMQDRVSHALGQLSGGELQRVAIARALVTAPGVLLADEPTGNLDERSGDSILALLREVCSERGVTTILVTHDPNATAYAHRVVLLTDGRLRDATEDDGFPPRRGAAEGARA